MKYTVSIALAGVLLSSILAETPKEIRGVSKSKHKLYVPLKGNKFACLSDPTKIFDFSVVNDDYCDCEDGSDEPGTSACPNNTFHCKNVGFRFVDIRSSRVNDGICDPECCDGSDEFEGKVSCPNNCKAYAAEFKEKEEKENKILEEGLKKKETYIKEFSKVKSKLSSDVENIQKSIEEAKKKIEELKRIKEEKEEAETQANAQKDSQASYRLLDLESKYALLLSTTTELQEDIKHLQTILKDMKLNHNQNYHDMAVKSAIKSYDEFVEKFQEVDFQTDSRFATSNQEEEASQSTSQGEESFSSQLLTELSTGFYRQLRAIKKKIFNYSYLISGIGEIDASTARSEFWNAESELTAKEAELSTIKSKLDLDYGPSGEYAFLVDKCFEKKSGDYDYKVCMFGEANQVDINGVNILLGKFSGWDSDFSMQSYTDGLQCWNGPNRSVKLYLTCGPEENIFDASEPEKCEYHLKMTTPAACKPKAKEENNIFEASNDEHDEL